MIQKPLQVNLDLSVKTYDIDFAGVVSNIVYLRWLEDLRLKILDTYLPLEQLMAQGYCPIVASSQIEYKRAIRMFDRPLGKMWVNKLGRSRCTLQAEIYLDKQIVTTATQVVFFIDFKTMRPTAIPQELKNIYTESNQNFL